MLNVNSNSQATKRAFQWLINIQCKIVKICHDLESKACKQEEAEPHLQTAVPQPLARLVLWFHHIKDLTKRKHIVGWASELGIRGFSKPGFPGVLICEGRKADVQVCYVTCV